MSQIFLPTSSRCFSVVLDTLTFYATRWELEAERRYAEQTGATGNCYLTNSSNRAKRLVLEGYFSFQDSPADVVVPLDSALAAQTRFGFTIRETRFLTAYLLSYQISETAASGILPCRLTFLSTSTLTKKASDTDDETEAET